MASTTHKQKPRTPAYTEEAAEDVRSKKEAVPATAEQVEKRIAETDALLDEIDEVLVTNAEEFVREYVQKGGQ